jgi:hypothetical protein
LLRKLLEATNPTTEEVEEDKVWGIYLGGSWRYLVLILVMGLHIIFRSWLHT